MSFNPDPALLNQVFQMLECALAPDNTLQLQANSALEHHSSNPQFVLYLSYVFVGPQTPNTQFRVLAGLILKNALKKTLSSIDAASREQLFAALSSSLSHPELEIRRTAASVIAAFIREIGLSIWPNLPHVICQLLDSDSELSHDGALRLLAMLAEDTAYTWGDNLSMSQTDVPILHVVPRLLKFAVKKESLAIPALKALKDFATGSGAVWPRNMWESYLNVLAGLTSLSSSHPKTTQVVIESFSVIVSEAFEVCLPAISSILSFATFCLSNPNEETGIAAANFWQTLSSVLKEQIRIEMDKARAHGEQYRGEAFSLIIPSVSDATKSILNGMVWEDSALAALSAVDRGEEAPQQGLNSGLDDIRPSFRGRSGAKLGGAESDEESDEELGDGPDAQDAYTLRQACCHALEEMSDAFPDQVAPVVLENLAARLQNPQSGWKWQEQAILALGVVAVSCQAQLHMHGAELQRHLLHVSVGGHPLVRSSALWSLGSIPQLLLEYSDDMEHFFAAVARPVLTRLVDALRDPVPRVQESACSALYAALSVLESFSDAVAQEFGSALVDAFEWALRAYSRRTRAGLLDVLSFAGEGSFLGAAIERDSLIDCLAQFNQLDFDAIQASISSNSATPDRPRGSPNGAAGALVIPLDDPLEFQYLDCVFRLAPLCPGFVRHAGGFWRRAALILQRDAAVAQQAAATSRVSGLSLPTLPVALDLMSSVVGSLGAGCAPLVHGLVPQLLQLTDLASPDLLQSLFLLLGTLCEHSPQSVWPHALLVLQSIMKELMRFLEARGDARDADGAPRLGAANNALWAAQFVWLALFSGLAQRGNHLVICTSGDAGNGVIVDAAPGTPGTQVLDANALPVCEFTAALVRTLGHKRVNAYLRQNAAVVLGILCSYAPAAVAATQVPQFSVPGSPALREIIKKHEIAKAGIQWPLWAPLWCRVLPSLEDDREKDLAVRGLLSIVGAAPGALATGSIDPNAPLPSTNLGLVTMLSMCASGTYEPVPPPDLLQTFIKIFQEIQKSAGPQYMSKESSAWNDVLKNKMRNVFKTIC